MADTVFAVKTIHSEEMYYHQIRAGKKKEEPKKKESVFSGIEFSQIVLIPVIFIVFYMTYSNMEMQARIGQALTATCFAAVILYFMNRRKKDDPKKIREQSGEEYDRRQAKGLLENSGLSGVKSNLKFCEDCFQVEFPGITTRYRYEGISWIKETGKYFLIFWNRSMVITVEKAGFYKGRQEQFRPFLEKKTGKTIERVKAGLPASQ